VAGEAGGLPVSVLISAANANDSTMLEAVLDDIPAIRMPTGRRRRRPGKLHAGKAYDHRRCLAYLRQRGIRPRIARRGDRVLGPAWPPRWTIERIGAWLGGFRQLRICYERCSERFYVLAMLQMVACPGHGRARHRRAGRVAGAGQEARDPGLGVAVVDAGGTTAVAGMVDAHSHLTLPGGSHWIDRAADSTDRLLAVAEDNARLLRQVGVRWARDVGGPVRDGRALSLTVRDGWRVAPAIHMFARPAVGWPGPVASPPGCRSRWTTGTASWLPPLASWMTAPTW
jgi:hypothetical protein